MLNLIETARPAGATPEQDALPSRAAHGSPGASVAREPLADGRLERAKRSYATARIDLARAACLIAGAAAPRAGDLVLARIDRLGHHRRIESPAGRRATLFVGDEVLLCYGDRYASDQFEAFVPEDLGKCHMVAAGGIAGRCVNRHGSTRNPTRIKPLGLVADAFGRVLNLRQFACAEAPPCVRAPLGIAVLGTSMNAGKTTTAATLARGLAARGHRVGVVKVTGTGAGGDRWTYVDAGVEHVLDFTDFGYASTYRVPVRETARILDAGINLLAARGCDLAVAEIADGLFFPETAGLVTTPVFRSRIDGVVLAAGDAMGAVAASDWLTRHRLETWAIAGCLTSSPLAMREARAVLDTPVLSLEELAEGGWLSEARPSPVARPA